MSECAEARGGLTRRAALAAGASIVPAVLAIADDRDKPDADQAAAPMPPPLDVEDLRLAALLVEYPAEHLTDAMLAGLRSDLRSHRIRARRLRSVTLENSDEPAFLFRAYRKD